MLHRGDLPINLTHKESSTTCKRGEIACRGSDDDSGLRNVKHGTRSLCQFKIEELCDESNTLQNFTRKKTKKEFSELSETNQENHRAKKDRDEEEDSKAKAEIKT